MAGSGSTPAMMPAQPPSRWATLSRKRHAADGAVDGVQVHGGGVQVGSCAPYLTCASMAAPPRARLFVDLLTAGRRRRESRRAWPRAPPRSCWSARRLGHGCLAPGRGARCPRGSAASILRVISPRSGPSRERGRPCPRRLAVRAAVDGVDGNVPCAGIPTRHGDHRGRRGASARHAPRRPVRVHARRQATRSVRSPAGPAPGSNSSIMA